jgi:hypothetical protein
MFPDNELDACLIIHAILKALCDDTRKKNLNLVAQFAKAR